MAREFAHNKPVFEHLHRRVYAAAIGLVVWYAVAAWLLFDRKDDIGLPLAMVSVLLLVAVLLPLARHQGLANETTGPLRRRRHKMTRA
jgi:hypothetical protein